MHVLYGFRAKQVLNNSGGLALIFKAADFAAIKHRRQTRKDPQKTPYINHPVGVARILIDEGGVEDPDVIASALLHDTVEDTDTSKQDLLDAFGEKVTKIVMEVTDDKNLPKQERKRLQIINASSKSTEAKLVKLADKIYNLRDLAMSTPLGWTRHRVLEYFDWAEKVFTGLRGTNKGLENAYQTILDSGPQI